MITNNDAFLIEKLKHDLLLDIENLAFDDCSEEEQQQICQEFVDAEYNDEYSQSYIGDDCGLYENASEQMGYIDNGYKENRKDLHYNLNYSQGEYAYLTGDFDLIKMISKQRPREKQLIKDLKYLHKQIVGGAWEQYLNCYIDYHDNLHDFLHNRTFIISRKAGFYDRHIGGGHHKPTPLTDADEFINALNNFTIKDGKKPACVVRIMKALDDRDIEGFFEDFEYNLKKRLYSDLESEEEQAREYWIEDCLKPRLKTGLYNRKKKTFTIKKLETNYEYYKTTEDLLCTIAMRESGLKIFACDRMPQPENMDFSIHYETRQGMVICEGIWNPLFSTKNYLFYDKELECVECYQDGVLVKTYNKSLCELEGYRNYMGNWKKSTEYINTTIRQICGYR